MLLGKTRVKNKKLLESAIKNSQNFEEISFCIHLIINSFKMSSFFLDFSEKSTLFLLLIRSRFHIFTILKFAIW